MSTNYHQYLSPMKMSENVQLEIQRVNNFYVIIDLEDADSQQKLTFSVQSMSLPEVSNEAISVRFGNLDVKFAGQGSIGDSSIVIRDLIPADIEAKIYEWRQQVHDLKTDKIGWASTYKKTGRLVTMGPDGTFRRTWELVGIWPTNMDLGEFSYEDNSMRTITLNLSIDRAFRAEDPDKTTTD